MYTNLQAHTAILEKHGIGRDRQLAARRIAWKMFEKAFSRGRRNRWLAGITRRSTNLSSLPAVTRAARHTMGTVTVPMVKIIGSESRSLDFDNEFNPVNSNTCERWIGIAAARFRGVALPAVELVQLDDRYYVRDGHHRISVARAFGQLDIEARIVN